ncbi:dTDP-4-dehydrorhamnose reductase [Proteiniphilum sp. UBA1028]|jgi:dTDP-4-dehydrorhamnose reductase|uniref:dTDP-4-dehydrorhamnose reductase n=1 Tax=Proteiniphilum sp. UBA1028 TaxID=1947251 RepID=UPI0025D31D36|nr:dTDP-4-dehydrorhamnose reductase [Proteiniphilum sp. UBA1028]
MPIFTGLSKTLGGSERETPKQQYFYGLVEKNVLVTGANGQLGCEIKTLVSNMNLPFRFFFTDADTLDITDIRQIDAFVIDRQIQYLINCAAYTAVDKAETDEDKAAAINVTAVANIGQVARKYGVKVIHISTDFVFDGMSTVPYTETMDTNPLSVYGKTKLAGEKALQAAGCDWMILRTSWLYSEFGANFVKTMIRLMHEKERLTIVDDQWGSPTYAADLAEMTIHILQFSEDQEWKTGVYHFSNRGETTWYRFAEAIKKYTGISTCELAPIASDEYPSAAQRPAYSVMNLSKTTSTFRVEIPEWKEALCRCLRKLEPGVQNLE